MAGEGEWIERRMARKAPSDGAESSLQTLRMECEGRHTDAFYRQDAVPKVNAGHAMSPGGWRLAMQASLR